MLRETMAAPGVINTHVRLSM